MRAKVTDFDVFERDSEDSDDVFSVGSSMGTSW